MKKLVIPALAILVVIAGSGSYFVGFSQGKSVIQKEIRVKEETYRKSQDAAKAVANKYLSAFKFNDFKEAYALTCPQFKTKISEQKFVKNWEDGIKSLKNDGVVVNDFVVDDVVIAADTAKIRFTETRSSALIARDIKLPQQSELKLVDGSWCPLPPIDGY